MNLELIRKYEKEFLHMLHGGTLMFKPNDKQVWFDSVTSTIDWTVDGLYVINDMYCTYRMALAEGKTVQYKMGTIANSNKPRWHDLSPKEFNSYKVKDFWADDVGNIKGAENYRIKPEEPKFKVGDWIRQGTRVFQYSYKDLQYDKANPTHCQNDEKWEPKEGEVCIFWDNSHTNEAMIARYSHSERSFCYPLKRPNSCYQNCMPFIGTVPPHMKDN